MDEVRKPKYQTGQVVRIANDEGLDIDQAIVGKVVVIEHVRWSTPRWHNYTVRYGTKLFYNLEEYHIDEVLFEPGQVVKVKDITVDEDGSPSEYRGWVGVLLGYYDMSCTVAFHEDDHPEIKDWEGEECYRPYGCAWFTEDEIEKV